jgi:hypothetical protein
MVYSLSRAFDTSLRDVRLWCTTQATLFAYTIGGWSSALAMSRYPVGENLLSFEIDFGLQITICLTHRISD